MSTENNQDNVDLNLLAKYNNKENPYSFGSRKTVYKYFPNLNRKVIDQTLLKSNVVTKFKKHRKPSSFLPVYVHARQELFQLDCIYMDGSKEFNNGYGYVLSIIDCWSKFAWLYPLKRIKCSLVVECLRDLFSNPKNIPQKISTDRGSG